MMTTLTIAKEDGGGAQKRYNNLTFDCCCAYGLMENSASTALITSFVPRWPSYGLEFFVEAVVVDKLMMLARLQHGPMFHMADEKIIKHARGRAFHNKRNGDEHIFLQCKNWPFVRMSSHELMTWQMQSVIWRNNCRRCAAAMSPPALPASSGA